MDPDHNKAKLATTTKPSHFAYIDAVRGLAFLAVLAVHSALSVGQFFGRHVFTQGGSGVRLFFLTSAITLCYSMAARQKIEKNPVLNFYLRRLFRIVPLFWLAIVFYWTCPEIMPTFWLSQWAPSGVHPSYFILTALFLHGWSPYTFNSIIPGGWSIAVEMTFYVFFPLVFRFLRISLKRTVVCILFGIIYLKILGLADSWLRLHFFSGVSDGVWGFFKSRWFPYQLPVFLIGFLAYQVLCNDSVQAMVKNKFWAYCILCFLAMILLSVLRGNSGFVPNSLLIYFALAGIIIALSGGQFPWLANQFVCYIGKISYSCYLVHFAALGITLKLLGIHLTANSTFWDTGRSFSNLLLFGEIISITLIFTMVISTITFHLIENPGIALGKKVIQRLSIPSVNKALHS